MYVLYRATGALHLGTKAMSFDPSLQVLVLKDVRVLPEQGVR